MLTWQRRTWLRVHTLEDRAVPATFTVSNLADSGAGSLRQAITDANAAAGADLVDATGVTGTISLLTALPTVTDAVAINGPGSSKLTVNRDISAGNFRLLTFDAATGTAMSAQGVTLTGGKVIDATIVSGNGGGIFLRGASLSLSDVVVTANESTANGGGIGVDNGSPGKLTIVDSTVSNNKGGAGGGIYFGNNGALDMIRSTVSGNSATVWGGGLYFFADQANTWKIRNSTISGNSATGTAPGGGIMLYNAGANGVNNLVVQSTTITGNSSGQGGGGIYNTANVPTISPLTIESSIVAGNTAPAAAGPDIFSGGTVNVNSSLIGVADDGFTPTGANNKTGTAATPLDAKLGALGPNGGLTFTHLPQAGSDAIDNGTNAANSGTDQRGLTRVAGVAADIGSVEVNGTLPSAGIVSAPDVGPAGGGTTYTLTVSYADDTGIKVSSIDINDITATGPGGSLTVTGVTVDNNTDGTPRLATYTLTAPGGSFDVGDNGVYTVSLKANEVQDVASNFIPATPLATFTVSIVPPINIVVDAINDEATDTDGKTSFREALIKANANNAGASDTISFSALFASAQTILVDSTLGALPVSDSVVVNPPAAKVTLDGQNAVQIMSIGGTGQITASFGNLTFTKGLVTDVGAAVFMNNANVTFANTSFTANSAGFGRGGAFFLFNTCSLTMTNCSVTGNTGGRGPGIYCHFTGSATINLTDTTLSNNIGTPDPGDPASDAVGGAISMFGNAVLSVTRCTISDNQASRGPGFYAQGALSTVTVTDSTIANNTPSSEDGLGGGISIFGGVGGTLTIRGSTIANNKAKTGGGMFLQGPFGVTIENSTISGNEQTDPNGRGGGIAFFGFGSVGSSFTMRNSTVTNNKAAGLSGGGMHMSRQNVNLPTIESSIISGNTQTANTSPDFYGPDTVNGSNNIVGALPTVVVNFVGSGNQLGTIAAPIDAKLGPLASNGGLTQTHALLPGSPAIDAGNNSGSLSFDQRGTGFARVSGSSADVGAFELQVAAKAPTVSKVQINDGSNQRSRVTSLVVTFDQVVNFAGAPDAAFQLKRNGDNAVVNLAASVDNSGGFTVVTLTFTGGAVNSNSLADGRYTLTALSGQISNANGALDGDNNGSPGGDFVLVGDPVLAPKLFRLFGDADGDGDVDATDFGQFRSAFGSNNNTFDFDNDGDVDATDFGQFRSRFGSSV